jgi:ubiquinone/menaquinone biosynthesis C-methylase UbiE
MIVFMEKDIYNFIIKNETRHWWFCARRNIVLSVIDKYIKKTEYIKKILDIGCGSGEFLNYLSRYGVNVLGVDNHIINSNSKIINANIINLPFDSNSAKLITLLDVLEHIKDEQKALTEIHRVLSEDGVLLATVPAYQFLYGPHDIKNFHYKRYSKKKIKNLFLNNGFNVEFITYFNFLLFPISLFVNTIEKTTNKNLSTNANSFLNNSIINNIFYNIFNFEKYILRYFSLPFGGSGLIVASKKEVISKKRSCLYGIN